MKKIYKYKIPKNGLIELPYKSEVLSANSQNGEIFIWALVDVSINTIETRIFEIIGTGFEFVNSEKYNFINTIFMDEYVFHIFEILE